MKLVLSFLVFLISFSCFATSKSAVTPQGNVTEYGIFAYTRNGGTSWVNPISTTPIIHEGTKSFLIKKSNQIPVIKSLYFAFSYKLSGLPDGEVLLDWRVIHPEMQKPDGTTSTGYSYKRPVTVKNGVTSGTSGYTFDEPYEMVSGEWQFIYSYKGQQLVSQKFFTVES
ncbi:DUF3859 domain-containing protein [Amphritea sp.]|uniref:DUF3859 domain-containing protein n=1 Tax=Amphritea sp. TaxID=1872502 RepID=UPI0025C4FA13|nr:DUF3859 domain-containing protein [Amphritea sp.]